MDSFPTTGQIVVNVRTMELVTFIDTDLPSVKVLAEAGNVTRVHKDALLSLGTFVRRSRDGDFGRMLQEGAETISHNGNEFMAARWLVHNLRHRLVSEHVENSTAQV